mgnify:CR=1 FL=1|tara:strand:- start:1030 stop:7833 length:6804 start_codon:yes stop_codon:yes gene_type:complete
MATRKEIEDAKAKKAAAAKKDDKAQKGQVRLEFNQAQTGLNMDSTINQVKTGSLTYALNATVENFDSSSVNYQNEPGNEPCLTFPDGFQLIGNYTISEKKLNIFFLANPLTGDSQIGFQYNNDCVYQEVPLGDARCLNFNIDYPIHKVVHRITNCSTEIYWTDGLNPRRYLDLDNIPYLIDPNSDPECDPVLTGNVDCNQLKIQPNFDIPFVEVNQVVDVGSLVAGTYQFAVQYSDATGQDLTSYYSVTNPTPISDPLITTVNFNYPVGKSIEVKVSNLDLTGQYQYFNLAVIKTINEGTTVELVGTYNITEAEEIITYTGADQNPIQLSIADIFEKYPYYDVAQDLTSVQDTLIWSNLTSVDRINYQQIASQITLQWESYRLPAGETYANELNAVNYRGYMRDEVYAFDIVFLLKNGKQTDAFHIPGPLVDPNPQPDVPNTNDDFIGEPEYYVGDVGYSPYWKIYNNATVVGPFGELPTDPDYKGPWNYGNFAYWESTEKYPCNTEMWGDLADQPIRHHKFPDVSVSGIVENPAIVYDGNNIVPTMQDANALYPLGVKIDNDQISQLIQLSSLTQEQKDDIVAFKIVRGDRGTNRSIVAKGILRNVNKYVKDDQDYYYPNYPYNQVSGEDSFLQENNNAWNYKSKSWLLYMPDKAVDFFLGPWYSAYGIEIDVNDEDGVFVYTSIENGKQTQATISPNCILEVCSLTRPVALKGVITIGPGDFDVWIGAHSSNCQFIWIPGTDKGPCSRYELKWKNPFNNFNFDGTVNCSATLNWGNNIFEGIDRVNVITNADPEFDVYGTNNIDFDENPGGAPNGASYGYEGNHPYAPTWREPSGSCCSNPRIFLTQIYPGPCTEPDPDNPEENYDVISYPPNTFDPNYPCPDSDDETRACQTCVKVEENPDNIQPWPGPGFGQPTNPLPLFDDSVASNADYTGPGFPTPVNEWDTFTPAENANDTGSGAQNNDVSKRHSRRSCLKCDRDIPIKPLDGADYEEAKDILDKQIFNSPDTSFGQPFLGSVLKLESVMFGAGKAHFVEVKDNAKYKLLSKEAQEDALSSSERVASMGANGEFDAGIMFTVYQSYLTIYINGITRKNYAMSFNSRANYDYHFPISNNTDGGIKQREIDLTRYLIPGVQSFNNNQPPINNWNRESSVFIDTTISDDILALPLPQNTPSLQGADGESSMVEYSRFAIGESGACDKPGQEQDIKVVSYYASMKNIIPNQWGQINSFKRIDTGYQKLVTATGTDTVFGGDVFISRFAFKTKIPFFIDNRVNAPDDSDIFFDELGNVAYPKYWHSARSILEPYTVTAGDDDQLMYNLISTKAHNLDCPSDPSLIGPPPNDQEPYAGTYRSFYDGYMYLFAYGVPNFYCESVYNTDLRQAFNTQEGDFWPHVSSGIPDDWVQETNVPIAQDNTYYYNVTYSKQNKENVFSQMPPDWSDVCYTFYPFRAIYSDTQGDSSDNRVNNWLVYRALSYHDFPQNFGNLTSLDGMMDRGILARFDNKALLYNKLLTIDTNNPQAAYIGNPRLFDGAPPIDFAETDLGYLGSQNKFLLKVPYGAITADAKRGQIFLMSGNKAVDLTKFGSGVNRFITNHLPFEILEYFPDAYVDNHFKGIGLHGVYDSKFDRVIITKLDYIPLDDNIRYDSGSQRFYVDQVIDDQIVETEVFLFDREYFCSKSWTLSFDFSTKSWISFHSYLPNFYIGENNFYYSGINSCCTQFTAVLDTPDRSRIEDEEPQIEMVVAANIGSVLPITTTSTSTEAPLFTTTSTTTFNDCQFDIGLAEELSCGLEGIGLITIPTPTTTTICSRPAPLAQATFTEGYQIMTEPTPIIGSSSAASACAIGAFLANLNSNDEAVAINFTFEYSGTSANFANVSIGEVLYLGDDDSCTRVPDGWYTSVDINSYQTANYVEDGILREQVPCDCNTLTTTTTMFTGDLDECCGLIYNDDDGNVVLQNVEQDWVNYAYINIPGYTSGKLAVGPTALYGVSPGISTSFKKWTITTSPWTVVADSDLVIADNAFGTTAGVVVKDDSAIIAIDTAQGYIVEIDTTSGIPSQKILLQSGYTYPTNLLYTTEGKLITIREVTATGAFEYVQWDYDNAVATPEIVSTITSSEFSGVDITIHSCDCDIIIVCKSAINTQYYAQFSVAPFSPFEVVLEGNSLGTGKIENYFSPTNITQLASCVSPSGGPTTTTTSTTLAPTTTTTTSIQPNCSKWEITGPIAISYTDCSGLPQVVSVATGQTRFICANTNTPGALGPSATLIGACDI